MTLAGPRLFPSAEGWGWSFSRFTFGHAWKLTKLTCILTNDSYQDLYLLNMFQPNSCWIMDRCFLAARADGIDRIGWTVLAVAGPLCHSATLPPRGAALLQALFPAFLKSVPEGRDVESATCCLRIAVASGFWGPHLAPILSTQMAIWGLTLCSGYPLVNKHIENGHL